MPDQRNKKDSFADLPEPRGRGRPPIVPRNVRMPTPEEREQLRRRGDNFLLENRRNGYLLEMARRHQVVPVKSSYLARNALCRILLPDLFVSDLVTFAPGRFTRSTEDLELALGLLGKETKLVRVEVPDARPPTLRVTASTIDEAAGHIRSIGLTRCVRHRSWASNAKSGGERTT